MEKEMNEEIKEVIRKVAKGELPREALPKPTLVEDLDTMYATENSKNRTRFGLYKCGFCGNEFKARTSSVKSGNTKSCGCYSKRRVSETHKTHGLGSTRLYNIWIKIKDRTLNPKYEKYKYYGGRGINICEEWLDVQNFYDWAMSNGYSDELSIDRIDNNGNYEPNNCRWVGVTIQARNQRIQKNNTSGYKGVSFHKGNNKYKAQIWVNNKSIYLGYFQTAEDGAIAYNTYIIENNLEGFILNEIPQQILIEKEITDE
jgi:hypothetical protein